MSCFLASTLLPITEPVSVKCLTTNCPSAMNSGQPVRPAESPRGATASTGVRMKMIPGSWRWRPTLTTYLFILAFGMPQSVSIHRRQPPIPTMSTPSCVVLPKVQRAPALDVRSPSSFWRNASWATLNRFTQTTTSHTPSRPRPRTSLPLQAESHA